MLEFFQKFYLFPEANEAKKETTCTTWKKRTWLQSQRKKADWDGDKKCRDFIFSTLPIKNGRI